MSPVPKNIGVILSCAVLSFLGALSGCQSATGKTASQTMTDASISAAVQTKLMSDRLSNFPRIDVDTERGVVNLSGVVETEAQRARVERLARQVEGVVRINNNLQLQNRLPSVKQNNPAHAQDLNDGQPERNSGYAEHQDKTLQPRGITLVQGDVVRVEGDTYFVRARDGREISLQADATTMKSEKIKPGDRVEVKIDQYNHALSMLPAP